MKCDKCGPKVVHAAWAISVDVSLCKTHYFAQKQADLDQEIVGWHEENKIRQENRNAQKK